LVALAGSPLILSCANAVIGLSAEVTTAMPAAASSGRMYDFMSISCSAGSNVRRLARGG
jgi:hypothetical protein